MIFPEISQTISAEYPHRFLDEELVDIASFRTELQPPETSSERRSKTPSMMKQLKAESQYQTNLKIQKGDEDQKFLKMIEELLKKDPTVLDLSVKHITDRQLVLLSEVLPSLNVKTLNLSHNSFEYVGMLALADALPKTQITNLNLGSTRGCALEKIIQILPQTKIQALDLYGLDILERDLGGLIWILPQTQIRDLDLGGNKITDPLFSFLMYCLPETKIMRLNLSHNNIRMASQETTEHFQCGIARSKLRQLDLSDNCIGDTVAFALAEALPFSKIQKLDISFCRIKEEGIERLASALSSSQIKELDLSTNSVGSKGLIALSNVLPSCLIEKLDLAYDQGKFDLTSLEHFKRGILQSKVQDLSFGFNNIGIDGVKIIAEILENGCLETLNLRCDRSIGSEGAVILAEALKHSVLKKLYFDSNNIQDKGCIAIAAALPFSEIEWLDLGLNGISDASLKTLIEAMKPPLKYIRLGNNSISSQGKEELVHKGQEIKISVEL